MATVRLTRPTVERAYADDYEALFADLRVLDITVEEPSREEQRGGDLRSASSDLLTIAFHLQHDLEPVVVSLLAKSIYRRLHRPRRRRDVYGRRAVTYGPDGRVLKTVDGRPR